MIKTVLSFLTLLFICHTLHSQTDTVLIDFGSSSNISAWAWNNLTNYTNGQLTGLLNSKGISTTYSIQVTDAFAGINTNGTQVPAAGLGIPVSATADNFFGNSVLFSGNTEPTGGVTLSGLDATKLYTVTLFASRDATDNRQTKFVVAGLITDSILLNASSNTSQAVSKTLFPTSTGTILVTGSPGPSNNNTYGFFYLNAMKLVYAHDPSTDTVSIEIVSPVGGEFWQVGKTPAIVWKSKNAAHLVLEYSLDGGASWIILDTVPGNQKDYPWFLPNTPSKQCLVRITSDTVTSQSAHFFEISPDTVTCRIVVLGSSTAAGAGASVADSAWVNLFQSSIFQQNTRFEVTNLAKGGYTTYHILPTGTPIPTGVTLTVDTARNVTKALSLNPFALIVNMPSNDASYSFTPQQQLDNYTLIVNTAQNSSVKVWVCTPQPRNFGNAFQIQIQRAVMDSILTRYQSYAINCWSGLADTAGFIMPMYNSGDGIHLNNMGHRMIWNRVTEKDMDTLDCQPYLDNGEFYQKGEAVTRVYPNPFRDHLLVEIDAVGTGECMLEIFDFQGKLIDRTTIRILQPGKQLLKWSPVVSGILRRQSCLLRIMLFDTKGIRVDTHTLIRESF